MYDEYGEVIMEDDGYYYSPHGPEVLPFHRCECHILIDVTFSVIASVGCVSSVLLNQQYQPFLTSNKLDLSS